ncbi:transcription factor Pur-alpha 1 [Tanacetum coccineum]
MDYSSGGGGNDVELLSKTLQVEHKLFYFDLKENPRGRYLKISEKTSATRSTIIVPFNGISWFFDIFNYYVTTASSDDQDVSSKELQLDSKERALFEGNVKCDDVDEVADVLSFSLKKRMRPVANASSRCSVMLAMDATNAIRIWAFYLYIYDIEASNDDDGAPVAIFDDADDDLDDYLTDDIEKYNRF